jgi:hypothetical protein
MTIPAEHRLRTTDLQTWSVWAWKRTPSHRWTASVAHHANLDIIDTREKLGIYAKAGLLSLGGVRVWCNKSVVNNLTCR